MSQHGIGIEGTSTQAACEATEVSVAELVGQVFEAAAPAERGRLLEQLLQPLGALSLVAVAGGIFAKLRFRSGWQDLHIRLEDARNVESSQVIALVDHVQQVSVETVDGLAQLLMNSPLMAGSAAAAALVGVLIQRARSRGIAAPAAGPASPAPS